MRNSDNQKKAFDRKRGSSLGGLTIDSFQSSVAGHKYVLTNKETISIFHKEIYQEIIKSSAFQRLKDIHFLGAIDYTVDRTGPKPNKRHNRYQHSLGVALLALQYARERRLSEYDEVMCVVAALLHDIGHAPLSHSLESVFKKEFGIGHHISGEKIIMGDVALGKNLHIVLTNWDINPFEIMAIISGVGVSPYREIFSYSINIDTIEAILRSTTYIFKKNVKLSPPIVMSAFLKLDNESRLFLDEFWSMKELVYSKLINDERGVVADFVCQKYMSDNVNEFNESYYYGTEKQLMRDHSSLFEILEKLLKGSSYRELLPDVGHIPCVKRKFFVDKNILLDSIITINERYKQEKTPYSYLINDESLKDGHIGTSGDNKNERLF